MDVALWIAAAVLAFASAGAGVMKLTQPKEKLQETQGWVEDFSQPALRMIGGLETLGAIGLIVPALLDIAPVLVPVAAVGLALLQTGALITHVRRREPQFVVNIVLIALAVFVAWGRFGDYAF